MKETEEPKEAVLVVGTTKLAYSITVCLIQAGHPVTLCTNDRSQASETVANHLSMLDERGAGTPNRGNLELIDQLRPFPDFRLAIAITEEKATTKQELIRQLETLLPSEAVIAINTESILLSVLQQNTAHPNRIIGANWTEPAHTTFFLELIANDQTAERYLDQFSQLARSSWSKDPYTVRNDGGIRTRMLCAMVREAFYLIENDYVTVADIDRACRNDPGYYLPFAGHFRYMDLMGSYIYGVVMGDLNPELSKDRHIPGFFSEIIAKKELGMDNGKGFYSYEKEEAAHWEAQFAQFSYQIQQLISKYPFPHQETPEPQSETVSHS